MEATELARPTTIPTLTCPLFGIGRLEFLWGMLLLPLFIMPLLLAPPIVIFSAYWRKKRRCQFELFVMCCWVSWVVLCWRLVIYRMRLSKLPLFWAKIIKVATGSFVGFWLLLTMSWCGHSFTVRTHRIFFVFEEGRNHSSVFHDSQDLLFFFFFF